MATDAEAQCPAEGCGHALGVHDFVSAPADGYVALHCKICFANGDTDPCHTEKG